MKFTFKREGGFSIIEIMVAVSLLAAVLVPIFIMFSEGINLTSRSTNLNLAVNCAQDKMEKIRNMPHALITIGTWPGEEVTANKRNFTRCVTVTDSGVTGGDENLKKITVDIFWNHDGTTHSTSLTTFRCNKLEE